MTAPRFADDPVILADLATHLLAERVAKYLAIVAAGKLSQADADTGIRRMRAVARRHRVIRLRDIARPDPLTFDDWATPAEQRETLAAAHARTAQIAAADPRDTDKADYAEAVAALLWHAEQALASPGAAT